MGSVVSPRMSNRIKRDGKPALQKSQELNVYITPLLAWIMKDLQIPKGKKVKGIQNSVACLDNELVLENVDCSGIDLGSSRNSTFQNIAATKQVEIDKLDKFHHNNPDLLLPPDIDITREEFNVVHHDSLDNLESTPEIHMNVPHESDSPLIVVTNNKSSRSIRKISFIIK